jgi:quinol monooxygenase YgiN
VQAVAAIALSAPTTEIDQDWAQEEAMTTISKDADRITFINIFTVEPSNQSRLVELLIKVTDSYVRQAPGFISASLHRSLDGTKVTMYSQWRSLGDYEAMRRDPGPVPYLQEALTIAKFEPGIYEVVESFAPAAREEGTRTT